MLIRVVAGMAIAIAALLALSVAWALAVYPAEYVYRTFVWGESDVEDGLLDLDEPVTKRLPELRTRDARFERFTLRHLLGMRVGIRYRETGLPNGDDAKTYYGPDLRSLALQETVVAGEVGPAWLYNNYHPLLIGLVLERATGMPVAKYLERRLWQPAGMAAGTSWSLDSETAGFETMESGVNARTLDFARFGQLMLDREMVADGRRVLSEHSVRLRTGPEGAADLDDRQKGQYYQLFWWGQHEPQWGDAFYARGKYGQFIFVSHTHGVVIVRNGRRYGVSPGTQEPGAAAEQAKP